MRARLLLHRDRASQARTAGNGFVRDALGLQWRANYGRTNTVSILSNVLLV
jgi:hypothetical protein